MGRNQQHRDASHFDASLTSSVAFYLARIPTGTFPKRNQKVSISRGLGFDALFNRLLKPVNPGCVAVETGGAISSEKLI
jgi:hypothetical protein